MTPEKMQIVQTVLLQNRRWVLKKSGNSVCGWCAVSAYRVYHTLRKQGLKPKLTFVCRDMWAHCFNQLDGKILDVTVEQFLEEKESPIVCADKVELLEANRNHWFWGWQKDDGNKYRVVTGMKGFLKEVESWGHQSPQEVFKRTPFSPKTACKL